MSLAPLHKLCAVATIVLALGLGCHRSEMDKNDLNLWTTENVVASQERGDLIVKALQAYHERNGRYPSDLKGLVPDYLEHLPSPLMGEGWVYQAETSGRWFYLAFGISSGSSLYPLSSTGLRESGWHIDS